MKKSASEYTVFMLLLVLLLGLGKAAANDMMQSSNEEGALREVAYEVFYNEDQVYAFEASDEERLSRRERIAMGPDRVEVFSNLTEWYQRFPDVTPSPKITRLLESNYTLVIGYVDFSTSTWGVWLKVREVSKKGDIVQVTLDRPTGCTKPGEMWIVTTDGGFAHVMIAIPSGQGEVKARIEAVCTNR
ncbi:hypothetical protein [Spongorhabdus nitratireducens]